MASHVESTLYVTLNKKQLLLDKQIESDRIRYARENLNHRSVMVS